MPMTNDEKIAFSAKVQETLAAHHARYPDSILGRIIHSQFNTAAIDAEDAAGVPRGTFGGVDGTVHPDSGGTDKGP